MLLATTDNAPKKEVEYNEWEEVFSTRYYPENYSVEINAKRAKIEIFTIRGF